MARVRTQTLVHRWGPRILALWQSDVTRNLVPSVSQADIDTATETILVPKKPPKVNRQWRLYVAMETLMLYSASFKYTSIKSTSINILPLYLK